MCPVIPYKLYSDSGETTRASGGGLGRGMTIALESAEEACSFRSQRTSEGLTSGNSIMVQKSWEDDCTMFFYTKCGPFFFLFWLFAESPTFWLKSEVLNVSLCQKSGAKHYSCRTVPVIFLILMHSSMFQCCNNYLPTFWHIPAPTLKYTLCSFICKTIQLFFGMNWSVEKAFYGSSEVMGCREATKCKAMNCNPNYFILKLHHSSEGGNLDKGDCEQFKPDVWSEYSELPHRMEARSLSETFRTSSTSATTFWLHLFFYLSPASSLALCVSVDANIPLALASVSDSGERRVLSFPDRVKALSCQLYSTLIIQAMWLEILCILFCWVFIINRDTNLTDETTFEIYK